VLVPDAFEHFIKSRFPACVHVRTRGPSCKAHLCNPFCPYSSPSFTRGAPIGLIKLHQAAVLEINPPHCPYQRGVDLCRHVVIYWASSPIPAVFPITLRREKIPTLLVCSTPSLPPWTQKFRRHGEHCWLFLIEHSQLLTDISGVFLRHASLPCSSGSEVFELSPIRDPIPPGSSPVRPAGQPV